MKSLSRMGEPEADGGRDGGEEEEAVYMLIYAHACATDAETRTSRMKRKR